MIPSRRNMLGALAAGIAGTRSAAQPAPPAGAPETPRAFRGEHQPKPLPFDPGKLEGLSERLVRSHWENNYGGAVKALNLVEERLHTAMKDKDLPPYLYGD